ncbi:proline-rich protein 20G [Daubentonia madagascariensis]|uniref:Proline-rich protein 20G n=1 Tax=Daubentonia madagascariensis TaxID=31869 RepID=A0ABD2FDS9_DAUMA
MEAQRPSKRLRLTASNQASGGHPGEQGCSAVDREDPVATDVPSKPGQPAKPIAYVKPMICETPAYTEAALAAGRGRRRGRSQRAERGRRRGAGRGRDPGLREGPEHLVEPDLHIQLDHPEEPGHHVELDTGQTPSLPPIEASVMLRNMQQGPRSPPAWPEVQVQELPHASGYGAVLRQPMSAIWPYINFRPVASSALCFIQTSFGTYVSRAPVFFTHITR